MEAFEKKFPNLTGTLINTMASKFLSHFNIQRNGRKDGWRAALEWARTQATDIQITELDAAIEKELED